MLRRRPGTPWKDVQCVKMTSGGGIGAVLQFLLVMGACGCDAYLPLVASDGSTRRRMPRHGVQCGSFFCLTFFSAPPCSLSVSVCVGGETPLHRRQQPAYIIASLSPHSLPLHPSATHTNRHFLLLRRLPPAASQPASVLFYPAIIPSFASLHHPTSPQLLLSFC